jgi:hypothetical protein
VLLELLGCYLIPCLCFDFWRFLKDGELEGRGSSRSIYRWQKERMGSMIQEDKRKC